tara:strand:+ start:119 stop:643 length:525 start_codon:yes stop_codon:yes gene_type:complete
MQNDHEFIKKFQNGDISAYDTLVRKHLSNTIGFFYNITGDKMVSEDLAQDVFFKLYRNLKKFRFEASFSTYLYRINLNTANSWLKRNKWKNLLHLDQVPDKGERDIEIEQEWTKKELWNAIAKLPNKQRMIMIMRITKNLTYKEIADLTGMSEGTAKVNYHHAVKSLKVWLRND